MRRSVLLYLGLCTFSPPLLAAFSFPSHSHRQTKYAQQKAVTSTFQPVPFDVLKLHTSATTNVLHRQQRINQARTVNYLASTNSILAEKNDKKNKFAVMMAFLTGIANITLNMKYKTFATMMTGNTMWMAFAATEARYVDIVYYASVIASYLVGLALFRKTDLSLREQSMKVCASLVTGLFIGSDVIFHLTNRKWLPVMMLASGFGIINSVGMEVAGTLTFVITGHMTKLTNQAFDRFSRTAGRKHLSAAEWEAVKLNASVIGGFFFGAFFACILKSKDLIRRTGLFSVMGIVYGALFVWQERESMDGAWWLRKGDKFCDLDDDGKLCENNEKD